MWHTSLSIRLLSCHDPLCFFIYPLDVCVCVCVDRYIDVGALTAVKRAPHTDTHTHARTHTHTTHKDTHTDTHTNTDRDRDRETDTHISGF